MIYWKEEKEEHQRMCLPVNFTKFLRRPLFYVAPNKSAWVNTTGQYQMNLNFCQAPYHAKCLIIESEHIAIPLNSRILWKYETYTIQVILENALKISWKKKDSSKKLEAMVNIFLHMFISTSS